MSKQIDERVVSMQFDNRNFENNVKTTMSTLDKLKEKLKFKDAGKSLDGLSRSAKNVDLSSIGRSCDQVGLKFNAMYTIADQVFRNITNSAYQMGKNIVSALTIDPIKTGLSEYETKMNAIQVIKANTRGKNTMDEITASLEELNEYADNTIYNFAQMTDNVGKYVAQMQDVKKATNAVKGMANLAAASGADPEKMARATYQMSQALGGYILAQDWMSLQTSNMASKDLEKVLTMIGELRGVNVSALVKEKGNFKGTLQEKWLTGDIFTEAMNIYSDVYSEAELKAKGFNAEQISYFKELAAIAREAATEVRTASELWGVLKETAQSGWTQTWELIFGDFEEAKKLFTGLQTYFSGIINVMSDARNTFLGGALNPSKYWNKIKGMLDKSGLGQIVKIADKVNEAGKKLQDFQKIYNEVWLGKYNNRGDNPDRKDLIEKAGWNYDVVQNLVNLGRNQKLTMKDVEKAHKDAGVEMAKTTEETKDLSAAMEELTDEQLKSAGLSEAEIRLYRDLTAEAKQHNITVDELVKQMSEKDGRALLIESFQNAWQSLVNIFTEVKKAWSDVFPPASSVRLYGMLKTLNDFTAKLKENEDFAKDVGNTFKGFFSILHLGLTLIGGPLKLVVTIFGKVLRALGTDIFEVTGAIGEAIYQFHEWVFNNKLVNAAVEKFADIITRVVKKVGTLYNAFKNSGIITSMAGAFKAVGDAAKSTWEAFKGSETAQKIIQDTKNTVDGFKKSVVGIFDAIKRRLELGGKEFTAFVERCKAMEGGLTFENISKALEDFYKNVFNTFIPVEKVWNKLVGVFNNVKDGVVNAVSAIGDSVGGFVDFVKKKFNINWGAVFAIGFLLSFILIIKKITDLIGAFTDGFLGGFVELMDGLTGVFRGFAKNLNAKALDIMANAILKLVAAVGILMLLSKVGNIWEAIGALAAIAILVAGLFYTASLFTKYAGGAEEALKITAPLMAISAVLLILAHVMSVIAKMSLGDVVKGMLVITAFEGFILGVAALSKLSGDQRVASNLGKNMLAMGASLLMMTLALKMIGSMSVEDIAKGLVAIAAIELLMGGLILISKTSKSYMGADDLIKSLGTTMLLLAITMRIIGGMSYESILKGIFVISALEILIMGLIAVSKLAGKDAWSAGAMIQRIGIAFVAIGVAMSIIGTLSYETIFKGLMVIQAMELILIELVAISKLSGEHASKAGSMILKIAFAFIPMAIAMAIIGLLDPSDIFKAIFAIGAITACFAVLLNFLPIVEKTEKASKGVDTGAITKLIIAVAVLAIALAALSMIDPVSLATATLSLSAVMGMFALLLYSMKFLDSEKSTFKKNGGILLTLTGVLLMMTGVIYILAGLEPERAIGAAVSLGTLMLALAVSLRVIKSLDSIQPMSLLKTLGSMVLIVGALAVVLLLLKGIDPLQAMGAVTAISALLLAMVGALSIVGASSKAITATGLAKVNGMLWSMVVIVGALAVVIGVLSNVENADKHVKTAIALSTLLISMSAVLAILTVVGNLASPTFGGAIALGLLGLVGLILTMVVVLDALGKLEKATKNGMKSGMEALAIVGYAIGDFVGSIVSGLGAGLTRGLPAIGENLSKFGKGIKEFLDVVSDVDQDTVDGAVNLAATLLTLTGTGLLDGLSKLIGGSSIDELSAQLVPFGKAMVAFSDEVSGKIDSDSVTSAANAGKMLAEMQATIPRSGGILQGIIGETNWPEFNKQIVPFGMAMVAFSNVVKGKIDTASIEAAANAGKMLAEMQATIPESGGLVQLFTGEHDWPAFTNQVVPFGRAMVAFSEVVKGNIDSDAVKSAANAGKMLAEMQETIPNSGGVVQWFTGEHNWPAFTSQIVPFGQAMIAFSRTVDGNIDADSVEAAANAGKMLAEMQETIPNSGGVISWFTGSHDWNDFNAQLVLFGQAMVAFSDEVSGDKINKKSIETVITTASDVIKMANDLVENEGVNMKGLVDNLAELADGMIGFSNEISGNVDLEAIDVVSLAGKRLSQAVSMLPKDADMSDITVGLQDFGEAMVDFSETVKVGLNKAAIEHATELGTSIAEMTASIPTGADFIGFSTNLSAIGSALVDFSNAVVDGGGINPAIVWMATSAGEMIADFVTTIPAGINADSINAFSSTVGGLGSAVATFSASVSGTSASSLTSISNACLAGIAMANYVSAVSLSWTNQEGIDAFINGSTSLAQAIVDFYDTVNGKNGLKINIATITNVAGAGKALAEFVGSIPTYVDQEAINTFVANVKAIPEALKAFSEGVSGEEGGVDILAVNNAVDAGEKIRDLINGMQTVDVSSFVDNAGSVAKAIRDFGTTPDGQSEINTNAIYGAVIAGTKIRELMSGLSNVDVSSFVDALPKVSKVIVDFVNDTNNLEMPDTVGIVDKFKTMSNAAITGFVSQFDKAKPSAKTAGQTLADSVLTGLGEKIETIPTKFEFLKSTATSIGTDYKDEFYNAGAFLVKGFASGISQTIWWAKYQARSMASAAANAAKEELDEHSPSRVGYEIGDFFGIGFVNGIAENISKSRDIGSEIAYAARSGLSNAIEKVRSVINSDMDMQPTIRPVLDLSDVNSGVGALNGMLSGRPSIGVMSNLRAINRSMSGGQNGVNDDVVSAINKLGNKLGKVSGDTYTVNGITYDDGSNITDAVRTLVRAAKMERRI